MKCPNMKGIGVVLLAVVLGVFPAAVFGAQAVIDFEGDEFGLADQGCGNPVPPMFNRPGYAGQSTAYIATPAACGQGLVGLVPASFGNDSVLTALFGGSKNNELRFSWKDGSEGMANDQAWLRLITETSNTFTPVAANPTIHIGAGSKVSMKIATYGLQADDATETNGALEFALIVRESGANLPLGVNGGTNGTLEFVGLDSKGINNDPNTPVGGTSITPSFSYQTIEWEFDADNTKVKVSIDGGAQVTKNIVGFTGDGVLSAGFDRGTLAGLAIRKDPNDTVTKKWFISVDDVTIDAPGITDPVAIRAPVVDTDLEVEVFSIHPEATQVRLIRGGTEELGAVDPNEQTSVFFPVSDLEVGQILTAVQTVDEVESGPSAEVEVLSAVFMQENFDGYANQAAFNAVWPAYFRVAEAQNEPERITLSTLTAASCPKSAYEIGSSGGSQAYRAQVGRTLPGAAAAGGYQGTDDKPLTVTWWWLHDSGTQCRNHLEINGYANHAFNSGTPLTQIRFGLYNSGTNTSIYNCDVFAGFSPAWQNCDQGPAGAADRKPGVWNKMQVRIKTNDVEFYINDVLVKTMARPNPDHTFDSIKIGGGLTNGNTNAWYDNISAAFGVSEAFDAPVAQPTVPAPILAGANSVLVTNVSTAATLVKVYANGSQIGQLAVSNQTSANVPVAPAPSDTQVIQATQTIGGVESCLSYSRVTAFASLAGRLWVTLGIREANVPEGSRVVGANGPTVGALEWVGGNTSPPRGKAFDPGPCWNTVTFNPATEPKIGALGTGGNGVLNGASHPWYVLEHLAITIDNVDPRPGPYTVFIDNVENDGVVFGNFEPYAAGVQAMFRQPSFSGSTASNIAASPTPTSAVSTDHKDTGTKSARIVWAFTGIETSRWLRLTTAGTGQLPNPVVRLDRTVTLRMLILPSAGLAAGPAISQQPASTVVAPGSNPSFNVSAVGTGVLHYQWLRDNRPIAGATSPTLNLTDVQLADNGAKFVVNICDDNGYTVSAEATLTVATEVCNDPVFDANNDDAVDMVDFGLFQVCVAPDGGIEPGCSCFDVNDDGKVNATDFNKFENCWTGPSPGTPVNPACDD